MSVLLVLNPAAGRHTTWWRDAVARELGALGPVDVKVADSADGTTSLARDAEARGVPLVVAAGGDGTVHRAVNGLTGTATRLGIIPVGTGNDLAVELGMPADPVAAARAIVRGRDRELDLLVINGRRVFTSGIFGAIAESALRANRMKTRWPWLGSLAYQLGAFQVIVLRGGEAKAGVFAANMTRLGGGIQLPSGGAIDDGICEISHLAGGGRVRLTRTLLALSAGRTPPVPLVWERASQATLTFENDVLAYGDGEDLGAGRVFEIRVAPKALRAVASS
jgi:diacylglycerol kinase (ATP)